VVTAARVPDLLLPWSSSYGEDARFRILLAALLVAFAVLASMIPALRVPELVRQTLPPPQLARVMLEKPVLPPAPPQSATPLPVPAKATAKPQPVQPITKPVPPSRQPPKPVRREAAGGGAATGTGREKPIELMQQARATAANSGVLQFKDDLAEMRESVDVATVTRSNLTRGVGTAEKTERALITGRAGGGSGGIDTAALSRDTGGIALSGRATTRIDGGVGGGGRGVESVAGRPGGSGVGVGAGNNTGDLVAGSDKSAGRSDESIRRVMDRNKGALFAIYNRALRQNAALQGKFVFEMVIEPGGRVSEVKLISSQLADQGLAGKILARIRLIDFGAASVLRTRVNYSFDFLPY
jgi:hypothetical protein